MKKAAKKVLSTVLILSLAAGYTGIPVQAKDMLDGYEVSGSVSTNSNSATAVTYYSRPGTIQATATVYGLYGRVHFSDRSETNTSPAGGASATAYIQVSGASVIGGKGDHTVVASSGAKWSYTSRTGDTFE